MLRCCRCVRNSLPFVPMALSTLDTLEQRLKAAHLPTATATAKQLSTFSVGSRKKSDQLQWFSAQSPSPFFISPKHDGVRLISYVPPTPSATSAKHKASKPNTTKRSTDASHKVEKEENTRMTAMTCYSRYGRPIYGLFWIEEELRLLRALCGDPSLIVDGELYLHQTHMGTAGSSSPVAMKPTRTANPTDAIAAAAAASPAETFKTGFLAVSALVHRLRGPSLQSATEQDILHYVSALPNLCVFDIPSYNPCTNALSDLSASAPAAWPQLASAALNPAASLQEQRLVTAELQRVRKAAMGHLRIRDIEQLRVVPNTTPFSQRLRTMSFLFQLLEVATASPVLRAHFCPFQAARDGGKKVKSTATSTRARSRQRAADAVAYHGGRYVCRIPYRLVTSLEETTQRVLPLYVRQHYEGAVIRSPLNPYDFKEKRRGTIAALVGPLLHADLAAATWGGDAKTASRNRTKTGTSRTLRGKRDREALLLSLSGSTSRNVNKTLLVRAYAGESPSIEALPFVTPANTALSEAAQDALDAVEAGAQAVRRAAQLPTRSETAVKVLAYQDREYAILRPLLKEPSTNPNTRTLVAIPRTAVNGLGYPIKPNTDTAPAALGGEDNAGGASVATKSPTSKATAPKSSEGSPVVVFYGLQCLAENGLVFNVSMPKVSLTQQKALLDHLLAVGKRSTTVGGRAKNKHTASQKAKETRRQKMTSLTGLYATVKFSTWTEHGLPRFGTVKAIRGGKGWFM